MSVIDWEEEKKRAAAKARADAARAATDKRRLRYGLGWDTRIMPDTSHTIVDGILHRGSTTMVYGAPKSGKSFLTTSLALAVADTTVNAWMGYTIRQHGPVLYVILEGTDAFWKRLVAAGDTPPMFARTTEGSLHMIVDVDGSGHTFRPSPQPVLDMLTEIGEKLGRPVVMVVIDTVWQSFGTGNVNDGRHVNAYMNAVEEIQAQDVAVALVHHSSKGNGSLFGSQAWGGRANTIIEVTHAGDSRTWAINCAKDDASDRPRSFRLDVVQGIPGPHPDEPVSSCRVVDLGWAHHERATEPEPEKPKVDIGLDTLRQVVHERSNPLAPEGYADVDIWRDRFYQTRLDASLYAKQKAFQRMSTRLQETQQIKVEDRWVTIL